MILRSQLCGAVGLLCLWSTAPAQQPQRIFQIHGHSAHELSGISVDGLGDIDGDGIGDFIVGAYDASNYAGEARVYSGANGLLLHQIAGAAPYDRFGSCVRGVGDVDADGRPDFAVGAFMAGLKGQVSVYSGRDGSLLHRFEGEQDYSEFGWSLAGAGDLDRDGHADILVGAARHDGVGVDSGKAYVFSGRTGMLLRSFAGNNAHDWFGYAVDSLGDRDGDGHPELLIGCVYDDDSAPNAGSVCVFDGQSGVLLVHLHGGAQSDWFGTSVAGLGDVNRDGVPDFAVGSPLADDNGSNSGRVEVFSGRDFRLLRRFSGEGAGDEFGAACAAAGDIDDDGRGDLLVGAYRASGRFSQGGSVSIFSLRNGNRLSQFDCDAQDDRMGVAVAGVGDINGDGVPDVCAGAVYASSFLPYAGLVKVWSGQHLALTCDDHKLSVGFGGTRHFALDAGRKLRGMTYMLLGTTSGTSPGVRLGSHRLPINIDSFTEFTLTQANSPALPGYQGLLDGDGRAKASFVLSAAGDPSLVGLRMHHAFLVYDRRGRVQLTSNAVVLTLTE